MKLEFNSIENFGSTECQDNELDFKSNEFLYQSIKLKEDKPSIAAHNGGCGNGGCSANGSCRVGLK